MTLATHAVIGASLTTLFPATPVLGFGLAVASHFLTDAIPHWDYHLQSKRGNAADELSTDLELGRDFLFDLCKIGFDFCLGAGLAIIIWSVYHSFPLWLPLLGVIGGVIPDFLQFVYFKYRREPLVSLQRFHLWIHTGRRWAGRYWLGVSSQILLALAFFLFNLYTVS